MTNRPRWQTIEPAGDGLWTLELSSWKHFHAYVTQKMLPALGIYYENDWWALGQHNGLRALNRMNINHATLFPDLQGAAEHCNKALRIGAY